MMEEEFIIVLIGYQNKNNQTKQPTNQPIFVQSILMAFLFIKFYFSVRRWRFEWIHQYCWEDNWRHQSFNKENDEDNASWANQIKTKLWLFLSFLKNNIYNQIISFSLILPYLFTSRFDSFESHVGLFCQDLTICSLAEGLLSGTHFFFRYQHLLILA